MDNLKDYVHFATENPIYVDTTLCCNTPISGKFLTSELASVTCPLMNSNVGKPPPGTPDTPENRTKKLVDAALSLIERRIKDGTATSQEVIRAIRLTDFREIRWGSPPLGDPDLTGLDHYNKSKHTIENRLDWPGWKCTQCEAKHPAWDGLEDRPVVLAKASKTFRPNWDEYFLGVATAVSARADCTRRQVGAVLVDPYNRIIGTGYNGGVSGGSSCLDGECPRGQMTTEQVAPGSSYDTGAGSCIALHAEQNALLYSDYTARSGGSIYITCAPCDGCMRQLTGSGLRWAIWRNEDGEITKQQLTKKGYIKDGD